MGRRRGSGADANTPVPVKFGLSPVAHIIVSTAASMKGVSLAEYVRVQRACAGAECRWQGNSRHFLEGHS